MAVFAVSIHQNCGCAILAPVMTDRGTPVADQSTKVKRQSPITRRTQAERSEAMRAKLAKAAFEVVAEVGHSAFRTAAVAARAGVSQGAQVHHFATKENLTLAALEYAMAQASELSERRLAAIPPGANPLKCLVADLREFFLGQLYWVALDIAIDGTKNDVVAPQIRKIASAYRGKVYANWAERLVESGWPAADSDEIVRIVASMLGGIGMRSMWEDVTPYIEPTIARLEQMIMVIWPLPSGAAPSRPTKLSKA